jgi:hypothetical protein
MKTRDCDSSPVIAVDHSRRVRAVDGIKVIRVKNLARLVHPARQPARLRLEPALLLKASRTRHCDDAISVLADACQQRLTTPARTPSSRSTTCVTSNDRTACRPVRGSDA